jgi:hypothetical protein
MDQIAISGVRPGIRIFLLPDSIPGSEVLFKRREAGTIWKFLGNICRNWSKFAD